MPSRLCHHQSLDHPAEVTRSSNRHSALPPQKKPRMSLSQTYFVASSARSKLGREAARPDHNLRRLVGHANLLDSLMLELQDAEREQEKWFNQTVSRAQKADGPRHIQWADTIVEEPQADDDEDDSDSDSTSDSDSDSEFDESELVSSLSSRRLKTSPVLVVSDQDGDEEVYYDDLEDSAELALVRTHSHSPPELIEDFDSEDESSPPNSPPQSTAMDFDFAADQKSASAHAEAVLFDDGFAALPQERNAPLIAALA